MQKKSLGRGLEEISNIFLSTDEERKEKNMTYGFSPLALREDSCASCTHLLEEPFGQPKCRIFSLESEQYGVKNIDSIAISYAKNCEYFRPIALGKIDTPDADEPGYSHQAENQCEVEESVKIRRTIAYQNDEKVQQNIRRALSRHLKQGFAIRRIELKKIEENSEPRNRVRTEEDVTIFIKGSLST
ncbi:MAG: hypothetical protein AMK69_05835 [Nitrospira bacterium SG8_3]|nr:MAG: hypothetical protein AMK69_05835 [Nitrospira bacterium SG8_3]